MQSILNQWSCNRCHEAHDRDQKYNKTRNLGVARVGADRTDCHWPKRSSKVDDFYVLWKAEIFFWEFYAKIKHFWCKIVTCFKMHLVNKGRPPPPLESANCSIQCVVFTFPGLRRAEKIMLNNYPRSYRSICIIWKTDESSVDQLVRSWRRHCCRQIVCCNQCTDENSHYAAITRTSAGT